MSPPPPALRKRKSKSCYVHVAAAPLGFDNENANPEMSDVGICVGSECRLANKKPTKKTNRCDDGKDAGQMHSQQFLQLDQTD